jgi:hypothetical protein
MRTRTTLAAGALLASGALLGDPATAQVRSESSLSSAQLAERTLHCRAVEAVIWGMPLVNTDAMRQASVPTISVGIGQIAQRPVSRKRSR